VRNLNGAHIEWLRDGELLHGGANSAASRTNCPAVPRNASAVRESTAECMTEAVRGPDYSASYIERGDGARHWIRVNVRDAQGKLLLVGNPIYLNRH
jgi:hypothetical protein